LPNGKPLSITFSARSDSSGQQISEMWKKTYDRIHIKMIGDLKTFPDLLKAEKECKITSRTSPWIADFPDGDNFMQNFYGPNVHQNNNGCSVIPEYDKLYAESQKLPNGPERDLLYHKMVRVLEVYTPIIPGYARYRNMVEQPRVIGYKKHPILHAEWMYIDIDKTK
ncbi:MAG: heme-binding protein, partial [Glaciimonas sp.]|nr:heme-binding protein [Glaciimonas sp.]